MPEEPTRSFWLSLVALFGEKIDGPLEVRTRKGEMGNVLWFTVDGERYVLSYNHKTEEIELKTGSTQGKVAASFSNITSNADVRAVFDGL